MTQQEISFITLRVENKILHREISFKQFEVDALIDDVAAVLLRVKVLEPNALKNEGAWYGRRARPNVS
jgi:hypothetical protein